MPVLLEVEFTSGVWTDITPWLNVGVQVRFGVESWDDDGQPAQITFSLQNADGRFTPDNPTSPYWPNVYEGIRVRFSVVHNATTYRRGLFNVKSWVYLAGDMSHNSTISVQATDKLGNLARRTMDSDTIERYRYTALANGATWVDAWPLTQTGHPRRPHNVGFPDRNSGALVDPKVGRGSSSYIDPSPLFLEGAVSLTTNKNLGPVLVFQTQTAPGFRMKSCAFWFKLPGQAPPTDDFAVVAAGWAHFNRCLWRLAVSVQSGNQVLEMHFNINDITGSYDSYVIDDAPSDNAWHSVYLQENTAGVDAGMFYDSYTGGAKAIAIPFLITQVGALVMGGDMNPTRGGSQNSRGVNVSIAGVMASDAKANGIERYTRGDQTSYAEARFIDDYANWGGFQAAYLGPTSYRSVALTSSLDQTLTDQVQQLARTISGMAWVRYSDDRVELRDGANMRTSGLFLTLTVGEDDDIDPGQLWRRGAFENPTRLLVKSPLGDGLYVDTEAELIERRDGSDIDSACTDPQASRALAAWYVRRGRRLRLEQFGVDVGTSKLGETLWSFVLSEMAPGLRVRVTGLDPAQFGYVYRDVHIIGWEETWGEIENGENSCRIVFNTVPADTPGEAIFEDNLNSGTNDRWDFDLQSASVGAMTSSSTSVVITSTGPALTTDPADYPLWLNVDGETVTVAAPPASSTSPQTVTVTRGTRGTVARPHNAGTVIQIYPLAGFGAG